VLGFEIREWRRFGPPHELRSKQNKLLRTSSAYALQIEGSLMILQIIGQMIIFCFNSLKPAGSVKDGALDTWLVYHSARSYLHNLQQQSPKVERMVAYVQLVCTGSQSSVLCTHVAIADASAN